MYFNFINFDTKLIFHHTRLLLILIFHQQWIIATFWKQSSTLYSKVVKIITENLVTVHFMFYRSHDKIFFGHRYVVYYCTYNFSSLGECSFVIICTMSSFVTDTWEIGVTYSCWEAYPECEGVLPNGDTVFLRATVCILTWEMILAMKNLWIQK